MKSFSYNNSRYFRSQRPSRLLRHRLLQSALLLTTGVALHASAATLLVDSTADSGPGSFRAAITAANENPGPDIIDFSGIVDPAATVPVTVSLLTALPLITDTVHMDASIVETRSLPGSPDKRPGVVLDLSLAAPAAGPELSFYPDGFNFSGPGASDSVVRGFVINGLNGSTHQFCLLADANPDPASAPDNPFPRQGYCGVPITIFAANRVTVAGNYFNLDVTGSTVVGTSGVAIEIMDASETLVGGELSNDRNVISAALIPHIFATMIRPWSFGWSQPVFGAPKQSNDNQIIGNFVGAAADGTALNPIGRGVWMALWNIEDDSAFGQGRFGWGVQCAEQITDPCEMRGNVVRGNRFNNAGGPSSVALFGPLELTEISDNEIFNTTGVFPAGLDFGRIEVFGRVGGYGPGITHPEPFIPAGVVIMNNRMGLDEDNKRISSAVYGIGIGEGKNILIADNQVTGALFEGIFVGLQSSTQPPQDVSVTRNALSDNAFANEFFTEAELLEFFGLAREVLSLDLGLDGVTANDAKDRDSGPNELQNFPVLTWAKNKKGQLRIHGSLKSNRRQSYRIEFFASDEVNPSGHGEGERYLGAIDVQTNGGGNTVFDTKKHLDVDIGGGLVDLGQFVSATATRLCEPDLETGDCLFGTGPTSEFSRSIEITIKGSDPINWQIKGSENKGVGSN